MIRQGEKLTEWLHLALNLQKSGPPWGRLTDEIKWLAGSVGGVLQVTRGASSSFRAGDFAETLAG